MTTYFIGTALADIHAQPNPASELVTQALLNTPARATAVSGEWTAVTLPDYAGWVKTEAMDEPVAKGFCKIGEHCATPLHLYAVVTALQSYLYVDAAGENILDTVDTVYLSTALPLLDVTRLERVQVALPGGRSAWLDRKCVAIREQGNIYPRVAISSISALARQFLGVPYLWGGISCCGIDCSGFVQLCYHMKGYVLPRDAHQQHAMLALDIKREELQEGDLIFFGKERIIHVALALNTDEFIHAEGMRYNCVIISSFKHSQPNFDQRLASIVHSFKRVVEER